MVAKPAPNSKPTPGFRIKPWRKLLEPCLLLFDQCLLVGEELRSFAELFEHDLFREQEEPCAAAEQGRDDDHAARRLQSQLEGPALDAARNVPNRLGRGQPLLCRRRLLCAARSAASSVLRRRRERNGIVHCWKSSTNCTPNGSIAHL